MQTAADGRPDDPPGRRAGLPGQPPSRRAGLPSPRGPLGERVLAALRRPVGPLDDLRATAEAAGEEDLQLSLYCCYELHYGGWPDVDPEWEWEPSLLGLRRLLEARFEAELRASVGPLPTAPEAAVEGLRALAGPGDGPSLSAWVAGEATLDHVRELAVQRSAYQLKEADPHTWAIPRLTGAAKAVMVDIQSDEYGNGRAEAMHSSLFGRTMEDLGLDATPNAYLDLLPAVTLATTNLISLLGLHRRLRGALVGHLALFEMTSVGPMGRYAAALRRLGRPEEARRFYEVHVEADELHQRLALDGMVGGLLAGEPDLAADVVFGARALSLVEGRFTEHVLGSWSEGRSSLLSGYAVGDGLNGSR